MPVRYSGFAPVRLIKGHPLLAPVRRLAGRQFIDPVALDRDRRLKAWNGPRLTVIVDWMFTQALVKLAG